MSAPTIVHSSSTNGRSAEAPECLAAAHAAIETLSAGFGAPWWLVDSVAGRVIGRSGLPSDELPPHWLAICRQLAERGEADFIADEEPLLAFAAPIPDLVETRYVAIGLFVSGATSSASAAAGPEMRRRAVNWLEQTLDWSLIGSEEWLSKQTPWPAERLRSVADAILHRISTDRRVAVLEGEIPKLSSHLADAYEEISLLHRLTRHLRISGNHEELCRQALEWLEETIPAESLALQLFSGPGSAGSSDEPSPIFLTRGDCPLDQSSFARMIERLRSRTEIQTLVANRSSPEVPIGEFAGVRELVVVPLTEGENLFGWLAAFNQRTGGEFGSPEASLLASVGALLGIHCGNLALYRQQADMLRGVVRALTSAIDAKDPYTCGHSDRVARISVALATEIGCERKHLDTLYLSGLLHDIGKIGIDDHVLRKTGKLTDAEYEHIKLHPEIGYRILLDLKQLEEILPVVRHHHEAWNGRGYPLGLAGEQIPQMARIVAVADAFDAMSSDRPYRTGMPDEQIDQIFREGAGKQWDAEVVETFFRIRDQVRGLTRREGEPSQVVEEIRQMN